MDFNESVEIITLKDEDGREVKLAVLEVVEFKKKVYALLADAENFENQDVLLVSVDGDDFNIIEDPAEFDAVAAHIKSKGK